MGGGRQMLYLDGAQELVDLTGSEVAASVCQNVPEQTMHIT